MLAVPGTVVFLAAVIYGIVGSRIVYPRKIDATYAWIKGAGSEFLESIDAETAMG